VGLGDTAAIRALAARLRGCAAVLRREADDLSRRAEAVTWTGLAASAMRRLAHDHTGRLHACADAHDAAAGALDRHAQAVDRHHELVAAIARDAPAAALAAAQGAAERAAEATEQGWGGLLASTLPRLGRLL
jgi:hypothetical protein